MKKMLLNFADKLLSAEQRKAVKGGYDATTGGINWAPSGGGSSPTGGFHQCGSIVYWSGGPTFTAGNCTGGYNGHS